MEINFFFNVIDYPQFPEKAYKNGKWKRKSLVQPILETTETDYETNLTIILLF